MKNTAMETVVDWGQWFNDLGVKPIHARRWQYPDEGTSSGAVRTDDGTVWGWSRESGVTEVWLVSGDDSWDGPELGAIPGMREARGEDGCLRLLSVGDPWDAQAGEDAADARRDDGLRSVFG